MIDKKIDFQIIPIFNQAAEPIWHDFVAIERACDVAMDYETNTESILKNYAHDWRHSKYPFGFGAYDGDKMIGLAVGYGYDGLTEAHLNSLYILPEYHRHGIGTLLLKEAEKTSTMIAKNLDLLPLWNAIPFYETNKYNKSSYGMEKELSPVKNDIVPVFQWIPRSFQYKFNVVADGYVLRKNKHQPLFVYINKNKQIDGIALRTKAGENKIWLAQGQNACRRKLINALNNSR